MHRPPVVNDRSRFSLLGIALGLLAPIGLFAVGIYGDRRFDPLRVYAAMAAGGIVVFAFAGWLLGRKDELLRAQNLRLRELMSQLELLSATDALTGIANRRAFDQRLAVEWARALRYGAPLSLVMVDLDRFKLLNDRHGHQAGDRVLRDVAATLDVERRPGDLVARYGGEEFVVILPHTDGEAARAWAERARERLAALPPVAGGAAPVTASFGVASVPGTAAAEDMLRAADRALYLAKQRGRNRVEVDHGSEVVAAAST